MSRNILILFLLGLSADKKVNGKTRRANEDRNFFISTH
jgi:hypothetical protein